MKVGQALFVVGVAALALLMVGCDTLLPPEPIGTATPGSEGHGLVFPTAGTGGQQPTRVATPGVGRLVLATGIDEREAPKDDRSALPAGVPAVYLAAELNHLRHGTTLVAVWRQDGAEVARTERVVLEDGRGPRWFALPFQMQPLSSGRYAVELLVNGRPIDSLVFKIGQVDDDFVPAAQLAFVDAWDGGSAVIGQASFPPETTQVVAVYGGFLDSGGSVYSQWYLDGRPYAEIGADPVVAAMLRSFTLRLSEPLPAGTYRVDILADGRAVASAEFTVEAPIVEEPATIQTVTITDALEPETYAPAGQALTEVDGAGTIYAAVRVANLTADDTVTVLWYQDGAEVQHDSLTGQELPDNWVAFPFELPEPSDDAPVTYHVIVLLNGETVAERSLVAG